MVGAAAARSACQFHWQRPILSLLACVLCRGASPEGVPRQAAAAPGGGSGGEGRQLVVELHGGRRSCGGALPAAAWQGRRGRRVRLPQSICN